MPAPVTVSIETSSGSVEVVAEVANTPETRERGLMERTELAEGRGMLFVFPALEEHVFWMKNTPLPLDMIFIDDEFEVVTLIENAQPYSTELLRPGVPSTYVLEVNGGFAELHVVEPGDRVLFDPPPAF